MIHYDRNLGKGYAVKVGALASRGDWVALIDADLDLDPASVPFYLEVARREGLDFVDRVEAPSGLGRALSAVASHRELVVPAAEPPALSSRRAATRRSGLKVFNRRVVDEVFPLLLVKQFAFDLELLAVATALGFDRIKEMPVRLEYRFTGSALGSVTVFRALWDTAAVFYRLRVLRTYQRKTALARRSLGRAQSKPRL